MRTKIAYLVYDFRPELQWLTGTALLIALMNYMGLLT